jgi:hypothetical protein
MIYALRNGSGILYEYFIRVASYRK